MGRKADVREARGGGEAGPCVLDKTDAVVVVGSSLMVYSGFRFVQAAARAGKPALR